MTVYIYNGVDEVPMNVTHVRVDPSVTIIHMRTFYNRQELQEVELPEGLIIIDDQAFYNCKSLKGINIPSSLLEIGVKAFANCLKLEQIVLPESLQTLGRYAFHQCESLQTITIPVQEIEMCTFGHCYSLTEVLFSEHVKVIELGKWHSMIADL